MIIEVDRFSTFSIHRTKVGYIRKIIEISLHQLTPKNLNLFHSTKEVSIRVWVFRNSKCTGFSRIPRCLLAGIFIRYFIAIIKLVRDENRESNYFVLYIFRRRYVDHEPRSFVDRSFHRVDLERSACLNDDYCEFFFDFFFSVEQSFFATFFHFRAPRILS